MNDKELKAIYADACEAKGFQGTSGQLKIWKQTLAFLDKRDLERALALHFQTSRDFPMPVELGNLAHRAYNERIARATGPETYTCWECTDCKTRMGSWNPDWNPTQCRGVRAVALGHPDYGRACVSRSFRIVGRDVYEKLEKVTA